MLDLGGRNVCGCSTRLMLDLGGHNVCGCSTRLTDARPWRHNVSVVVLSKCNIAT